MTPRTTISDTRIQGWYRLGKIRGEHADDVVDELIARGERIRELERVLDHVRGADRMLAEIEIEEEDKRAALDAGRRE